MVKSHSQITKIERIDKSVIDDSLRYLAQQAEHYNNVFTCNEIQQITGLSPKKIRRLLQKAMEMGRCEHTHKPVPCVDGSIRQRSAYRLN